MPTRAAIRCHPLVQTASQFFLTEKKWANGETLVKLIANSQSKRTQKRAAKSLEKIDPGNAFAVTTLVKLTAKEATGD